MPKRPAPPGKMDDHAYFPSKRREIDSPHAPGMVSAAAGRDHYAPDAFELFGGELHAVEHYLTVPDARVDGGLERPGLLHDLLEHEVLVAALFRGLHVPHHPGDGLFDGLAGTVVDRDALRR